MKELESRDLKIEESEVLCTDSKAQVGNGLVKLSTLPHIYINHKCFHLNNSVISRCEISNKRSTPIPNRTKQSNSAAF
jgi:hypothetical protein